MNLVLVLLPFFVITLNETIKCHNVWIKSNTWRTVLNIIVIERTTALCTPTYLYCRVRIVTSPTTPTNGMGWGNHRTAEEAARELNGDAKTGGRFTGWWAQT